MTVVKGNCTECLGSVPPAQTITGGTVIFVSLESLEWVTPDRTEDMMTCVGFSAKKQERYARPPLAERTWFLDKSSFRLQVEIDSDPPLET